MTRPERTAELVRRLPLLYPDAHCELVFSNALELLVATILSAQCTDKRVNIVTATLFQRCRTAADYADIAPEALEEIIHSAGFYRAKARSIRAMAAELVATHGGEVPRTLETLHALPGVGRKTANVVLGNAFGLDEGVVVDTHVGRLSQRLGLTKHGDPEKIERDLMKLVPREHWTLWSHWLIAHGRARCFARNPDCHGCELHDICPPPSGTGRRKRQKSKCKMQKSAGKKMKLAGRRRCHCPERAPGSFLIFAFCILPSTFAFMSTVPQTLAGKTGLVFGVANKRSIAWGIAQAWAAAGAKLIFSYQGERIKGNVEELVEDLGADTPFYPCDVSRDEDITEFFKNARTHTDRVDLLLHSVAFAPKEASRKRFPEHHPRGLPHGARHQRVFAGGIGTRGRAADDQRRQHHRHELLRRGKSHPALQRHGRGQGEPGGVHALSRV